METTFTFDWTGQIAGFSFVGNFSYDSSQTYEGGIVREEDLTDFDVSFFDPDGTLLRTYEDNQLTYDQFNFAFDTNTQEILQDGSFDEPDGIDIGEYIPLFDDAGERTGATGLNFWSAAPAPDGVPIPHVHLTDFGDEFPNLPMGFSSHLDVAFFTRTTQELLDTGGVGDAYVDQLTDLDEVGARIQVELALRMGTDAAETLLGDATDNTINALGGDDVVAGNLGDDIITGGDGDDILRGDLNNRSPQDNIMGGNDIIFGGEGSDRIGGKSGNDILSGDAGDDFIWGDDGDDIITGGTGNDTLVGDNFSNGSGSDLFVFGSSDGTDTILDFEVGTDRIGLVEGELLFTDLTLTQDGANTLLGMTSSNETLAILNNVQASALGESSFEVVADISNPEEAMALI
ncbi:calcium-binding protein [cf. Phormidesmis sp. LEGE 11477]|uniref:calcium-binding protein n=1 Tax=cf. Phormidesmis sp. LEGE 11477 TaxID=1828680 RepID=UPI001D154A50|nr:calcium-binding protein [cf. Phormidesmis sp. LEGE 11477]